MLVVMRHDATPEQVSAVVATIQELGYEARPMPGRQRTSVGLVGNDGRVDSTRLEGLAGVQEVIHVSKPYKQVSREWRDEPTVIRLPHGITVGGTDVVVMAGPCSVESEAQIVATARAVRESGATVLRAGAFKPRSSPYAFQGLGQAGLDLLALARRETGLLVITEAMDPEGLDRVVEVADIVQIGARNMQNYSLLRLAGRCGKPVLLKRGMSATIQELLLSAEYLLAEGNPDVMLCERGIRGFDPATRNVFDLAAIPAIRELSHLPVIADPSHGTGRRDMVTPMARAAVAAGADGLLVEVHPEPERARRRPPDATGRQSHATRRFRGAIPPRSTPRPIHRTDATPRRSRARTPARARSTRCGRCGPRSRTSTTAATRQCRSTSCWRGGGWWSARRAGSWATGRASSTSPRPCATSGRGRWGCTRRSRGCSRRRTPSRWRGGPTSCASRACPRTSPPASRLCRSCI